MKIWEFILRSVFKADHKGLLKIVVMRHAKNLKQPGEAIVGRCEWQTGFKFFVCIFFYPSIFIPDWDKCSWVLKGKRVYES